MTRSAEPGGLRNTIGLKISDDMAAGIESARGVLPVADYLRGLISAALLRRPEVITDWEQRARDAERRLERVREALD